jgi:5-(aminomethyl)-3-furanmethanol phosphate kinase
MSSKPVCRVVKLGGSLLKMPDLAKRFQAWLGEQPTARTIMLVGGGEIVDAVRDLDRIHHFDPRWSHWLCVDLLKHTADVARQLLPEAKLIATLDELLDWQEGDIGISSLAILQVSAFYTEAKTLPELPEGWATTSDSLAAYLAKVVAADELVLLKSAGEDDLRVTLEAFKAWRNAGLVDEAFPTIAVGIPRVCLVNLRAT